VSAPACVPLGLIYASVVAVGIAAAQDVPSTPDAGAAGNGRAVLAELCGTFEQTGAAVDLSGQRYAPEQARDPDTPVATVDARQSMLLLPGGHFLLRTSTLYPGGIEFRFRTIGSPAGEQTIDELGWRDGDVLSLDDAAAATTDDADLRMLVPSLLACDAIARGVRTTGAALVFRDGAGRDVTMRPGDGRTLASAAVGDEEYRYGDWRPSPHGLQPAQVERLRKQVPVARWSDVRIAPAPGKVEALAMPRGFRPAQPPGRLRATSLGAGAYRIDGAASGYHGGFVVGTNGIALFDAPVGVEEAGLVRAVIEQAAPGRPIAYVVLSHHHGDHLAGLPAYAQAQVIAGAGGGPAIRRQFPSLASLRLREITAPMDLDLGGQTLRVLPVPSGHAATMVAAYAPLSQTLFQGDLFYLPERGPVPAAFQTGLELMALIERERLAVRDIVGVHGRTGTLEDLRRAIALRSSAPNDRGGIGPDTSLRSSPGLEPRSNASQDGPALREASRIPPCSTRRDGF